MAINFNVNPYYDDYNEDKGFHRILFKPGFSVQARELTQLQTILQKQVERMGRHFFEDGAMVIPGQVAVDVQVKALKLTSASVGSNNLNNIFAQGNLIITGSTTGVQAVVLTGVNAEGSDPPTLIVRFTKTGTNNTTKEFGTSETITITGRAETFTTAAATPVTDSSMAFIQEGVFFAANSFIKVLSQKVVLEKYSSTPSYRVGLALSEDIVTASSVGSLGDTSLFDNAIGSPNESAPGADRYRLTLTLTKLPLDSTLDQDFIELCRIVNGELTRSVNRTQYSYLERTLARRTYDESGNYTVTPFKVQVREHRNNDQGTYANGQWPSGRVIKTGDVIVYDSRKYVATTDGTTNATAPTHTSGLTTINSIGWLYNEKPYYNLGVYTDGDPTKIAVGIEPGKAYVEGYEIETISTNYVPVPKAREFTAITDDYVTVKVGNYVLASNLNVMSTFSTLTMPAVNLYNQFTATGGTGAGTKVGTARLRYINYDSGNIALSNAVVKLSLFDISMDPGYSLSRDVKQIQASNFSADIAGFNSDYVRLLGTGNAANSSTITGSGSEFSSELKIGDYIYFDSPSEGRRRVTGVTNDYSITVDSAVTITNSTLYRIETNLKEPENTGVLFDLPPTATKTTGNLTVAVNTYEVAATNGGGTVAFTTTFMYPSTINDFVFIKQSTGVPAKPTTFTQSAPNGSGTSTISIGGLDPSTNYIVFYQKSLYNTAAKTKTLTTATLTVSDAALYKAVEISMGVPDVFSVESVKQGSTDITDWFILDNGQRVTHYDIAKLIRKPDFPEPTGTLTIQYRYFTHAGTGYFSVNSYSIPYDQIPIVSGDNYFIRLANALDFRPVKSSATAFASQDIPHISYPSTKISYSFYVPRRDKISIDLNGKFSLTQGASAIFPQEPSDPKSGMTLYKVSLQPYTLLPADPHVTFEFVDNKRYTMRDIGSLEKRIDNIEYYTALSLLEQETAALSIRDGFGLERYKNGFIVDNFSGHGVGDVTSPDYQCSIDMENNELRPLISTDNINLVERYNADADRYNAFYSLTGDVITLRYEHEAFIEQKFASRVENVNPFAVATFSGELTLTPPADEWFETENRPEIIINEEGNFDAISAAMEASGALNPVWNHWEYLWAGTPTAIPGTTRSFSFNSFLETGSQSFIDATFNRPFNQNIQSGFGWRDITLQTQSREVSKTRTGIANRVIQRIDRRVIEDKVVGTATIPFIRSRRVRILGRGFKPNSKLYGYFDDVNITSYITPATKLSFTPTTGTFDYEKNQETYGEETARAARRVSGDAETAFNRGDIVYVSVSGGNNYTLQTSPATGVVGFTETASANVLHLINVTGTFSSGVTVSNEAGTATGVLTSTGSAAAEGADLISNANGDFCGVFRIPNSSSQKFRTGNRELIISDSSTNVPGSETTAGRAVYSAVGILQTRQATVAAVRNAEIEKYTVRANTGVIVENNDVIVGDTGWVFYTDPLAQTFLIDRKGGCFITKVDIFFSTKDANVPVTLEIRNTVNGYPGQRVLAFSRTTLTPDKVNVSSDASVATTFTFKSPVYLAENAEYCIVLLSDSVNYRVWISQMGEVAVGTDRKISQQPYLGVLFKSQNASTWTADQLQDLKFTLYRAKFDTGNTAVVPFVNETIPARQLPVNSLKLSNNSSVVTVIHPNHGMVSGSNVTISGFSAIGGITTDDVNKKHTIGNVLLDSYTISVANSATLSTVTGDNIKVSEDIVFNLMHPIVQMQTFSGTTTTFGALTSAAGYQTAKGAEVGIVANQNNYFSAPQAIHAVGNESTNSGVARKSFELIARMSSNNNNISPVIDLNRTSAILVSNRIDDITVSNANFSHHNKTIITGNTNIAFSGNVITTTDPTTANILAQINVGKTVVISGAANPTNNATVVVSSVSNVSGTATVRFFDMSFVTETAGAAVTIVQKDNFIDERAYGGGSAAAKYVTRQINLENPSQYLRIMFNANVPPGTNIDVYYKTLTQGSNVPLGLTNYQKATYTKPLFFTTDNNLFTDAMCEIENLPLFSAVAVKLVFRSNNTSYVPRVKDLRVIVCP